jgi:polar amino acid transport system substrate-binding protein
MGLTMWLLCVWVLFAPYTPQFWELQKSGALKVDFAKDDLSNLRLLLGGRVDGAHGTHMACLMKPVHVQRSRICEPIRGY